MKRTILCLVLLLCLLAAICLPVCATDPYLSDGAALLTEAEAAQLEQQLSGISSRQKVDIVIVTVDSTDGQDMMDYADDYFDYHDYSADGILLLISMEDGEWWVSTAGYGITAVTDAGLDYMSEQFVPYLSDGDFAAAFTEFANRCDAFITQAKTGDPYDSHNLPKEPFSFGFNLVIAVAIGLVTGLITTGSMKKKLRSVQQQARADDYITPGSLQLSVSRDLFLYTHLDKREKPQSSSGSSTHTSSSGTTHGGGGGKF